MTGLLFPRDAGALATWRRQTRQQKKPTTLSAESWGDRPKLVTSNSKRVAYVLSLKCYPCPELTHLSPLTSHHAPLTSHSAAGVICYWLSSRADAINRNIRW